MAKLKHAALFVALALGLMVAPPADAQAPQPPPSPADEASARLPSDNVFRLFLDESQVKIVKGLKRVSVTNPRIADVVVIGPDEIRLDGLATGRTTMFLWDAGGRRPRYEVVVIDRRDDMAAIIKEAINLPEVVVQVVNRRTLLKGYIDNEAQRRVAVEIARIYQEPVVDLMQTKGQGSVSPEAEIKRILGLDEVKVSVIYDPRAAAAAAATGANAPIPISAIILEGFVDDQRDFQRADVVARAYSGNVSNLIEVSRPLQVLVQTHLLEMSVTDATQYGFDWGTTQVTGTLGAPFTVGANARQVRLIENVFDGRHGQGTFFGAQTDARNNYPWEFENINRLDPLFLTINWLISKGKGKVLANPRVVTRSGVNAEVNVGGQIVFPLVSATGTPTTGFQPFGVVLNITPDVDHKGNINTKLNVTVSNPDNGLGTVVGGAFVPGLRTRTTRSEVAVKDGEHIIVSGLLSETVGKNHSKTPYLSRLPLIGDLFTTKRYDIAKTELVVVVTPNLVTAEEKAQLATALAAKQAAAATAREPGTAKKIDQVAPIEAVITPAGAKVVDVQHATGHAAAAPPSAAVRTAVSDGRAGRSFKPDGSDYLLPQGSNLPPNPAAGVQSHGADPKLSRDWAANKTAFGYAPGREPVRPGASPKPKVPSLPPGDNTARGRIQGMLAGMREQVRWSKDQREMDMPIPPDPPEYVHHGGAGRNPPYNEPYYIRTYDSMTPREALRREALANSGMAPTGYVPKALRLEQTQRTTADGITVTPSGRTVDATHGAVIVGDRPAKAAAAKKLATNATPVKRAAAPIKKPVKAPPATSVEELETMSDEAVEHRFQELATDAVARPPRVTGAPLPPPPAEKPRGPQASRSAPRVGEARAGDAGSDKEIFKELEAAFDRVKSRTQADGKL